MNAQQLKQKIFDDELVEDVLEALGMHNIKHYDGYIACSWSDGDNPNGCIVYLNEYLTVTPNTRYISDKQHIIQPDIITLTEFTQSLNFMESMKFLCDYIGIGIYDDFKETLPDGLAFMMELEDMNEGDEDDEDRIPIKIISDDILKYYYNVVNDMFLKDNISYQTQEDFEIGYDDLSNRITIPIRDEFGNLVGVKGRLFKEQLADDDLKYMYLEKTPRNKILYGLDKTYSSVIRDGRVYVTEAEKGVMQLWDMGFTNGVATSGSRIGREQLEKLTRLNVDVVFAFDKDIKYKRSELKEDEMREITLEDIANQFIDGVDVYAIIDTDNILDEKESPTDNPEKWRRLVKDYCYKIK